MFELAVTSTLVVEGAVGNVAMSFGTFVFGFQFAGSFQSVLVPPSHVALNWARAGDDRANRQTAVLAISAATAVPRTVRIEDVKSCRFFRMDAVILLACAMTSAAA